ncbi:hypothetical protein NBRC116584_36930 [Hydrogenophaga sp. 5NK40-0174]
MPLLVALWLAGGQANVESVGWVSSAYYFGVLISLLALPMLRMSNPHGALIVFASAVLPVVFWLSGSRSGLTLAAAWLAGGLCAGLMQYVGSVVCAGAQDKRGAFAIRLATSLLLAGCVTLLVAAAAWVNANWVTPATVLVELLFLLLALYLLGYHAGTSQLSRPATSSAPELMSVPWLGVLLLFCLFVGQIGFYAFALKGAAESVDTPIAQLLPALAVSKVLVGFIVMVWVKRGRDLVRLLGFGKTGLLAGGAVFLISSSGHWWVILLALAIWELSFNSLVAAFLGEMAKLNPLFVGMWSSIPVFLGSAVGPILHGWLISGSLAFGFVVFAIATPLLPAVWVFRQRRA